MAAVSILAIVLIFVVGAIKKIKMHIGILALALTGLLGTIAGMSAADLFAMFPTSLFLRLAGTMLLFAVAKQNGCFELLARKMTSKLGKNVKFMPYVLMFAGLIMQTGGGEPFASSALMASLGVTLAKEVKGNPLLYGIAGIYGCAVGSFLPVGSSALVSLEMATTNGIEGFTPWTFFLPGLICYLIALTVLYIVLKGYKVEGVPEGTNQDLPKFTAHNYMVFGAIVVLFALTLFGTIDIAFISVILSVILCIVGCGEGDKIIKDVSMGTVMLVCGVGMLLAFCQAVGGFVLISETLAMIMTSVTAGPIMSLTGSFMSLFASASTSMMSLIGTVPGIVESVPGASAQVLVISITCGACATSTSPFSLLGSFIQSAITNTYGEEEAAKIYTLQMGVTVLAGVIFALVSLVGVYYIFI